MSQITIPKYITGSRDTIVNADNIATHTLAKCTDTNEMLMKTPGGWIGWNSDLQNNWETHRGKYQIGPVIIDAPVLFHIDASDKSTLSTAGGSTDVSHGSILDRSVRCVDNSSKSFTHRYFGRAIDAYPHRPMWYNGVAFGGRGAIHIPSFTALSSTPNCTHNVPFTGELTMITITDAATSGYSPEIFYDTNAEIVANQMNRKGTEGNELYANQWQIENGLFGDNIYTGPAYGMNAIDSVLKSTHPLHPSGCLMPITSTTKGNHHFNMNDNWAGSYGTAEGTKGTGKQFYRRYEYIDSLSTDTSVHAYESWDNIINDDSVSMEDLHKCFDHTYRSCRALHTIRLGLVDGKNTMGGNAFGGTTVPGLRPAGIWNNETGGGSGMGYNRWTAGYFNRLKSEHALTREIQMCQNFQNGFHFGSEVDYATSFNLAESIVIQGHLSDQQLLDIGSYLAQKWDLLDARGIFA